MAIKKLSLKDWNDRFAIDTDTNRLKFDGIALETEIGLNRRDFMLAVAVAIIAAAGSIASWVSAISTLTRKAPPQPVLSCPAAVINTPPAKIIYLTNQAHKVRAKSRPLQSDGKRCCACEGATADRACRQGVKLSSH